MRKSLAGEISKINGSIVSPDMVSLPIGRSYFLGKGYTDAKIHTAAVVSSLKFQRGLLDAFSKSAIGQDGYGVYIGMGGMMNLSYIASLKPKAAVLLDVNPVQTLFWQEIVNDVERSRDIGDFKCNVCDIEDRLRDRLRSAFSASGYAGTAQIKNFVDGGDLFRGRIALHHMMDWPLADFDWVREDAFSYFKQMAVEGNLAPLTLDIADSEAVSQLSSVLDALSLPHAAYVHVSNVLAFMKGHTDWVGRVQGRALIGHALDNIGILCASAETKVITDNACVAVGELPTLDPLHELAR